MNKKGNFNVVEFFVYFSFVIVLTIFIFIAAFSYLNEDIDTINLETFILIKKITYSDSCLAHQDYLGIRQSIIDVERLNSETLNKCYTKQGFGYLIKLSDENDKIIKSASNLNARQEAYLPICSTISKARCNSKKIPILYYEGEKRKSGFLDVEVIKLAV